MKPLVPNRNQKEAKSYACHLLRGHAVAIKMKGTEVNEITTSLKKVFQISFKMSLIKS